MVAVPAGETMAEDKPPEPGSFGDAIGERPLDTPVSSNGRPSDGVPHPRSRNLSRLHADDKTIIIAVGGGAVSVGLLAFYDHHSGFGTLYVLSGLASMAPISPFVRSRVKWVIGRPALSTLAVTTWLFAAALLGLHIWPILESDSK